MSKIAFMLDFEPGHLFPALGLATALEKRGHETCFLSIPDLGPQLERRGFEFIPVFADVYPQGEAARIREQAASGAAAVHFDRHLASMIAGSLDEALAAAAPDLLLCSLFLSLEALVLHYRYDFDPAGADTADAGNGRLAILTEYLRALDDAPANAALQRLTSLGASAFEVLQLALDRGAAVRGLEDLVWPLAAVPELIACPRELDLPGIDRGPRARYLGPGLRAPEAGDEGFSWPPLGDGEKLIYVSLGSQIELYPARARRFYREIFELAKRSDGEPWHFLVSVPERLAAEAGEAPANLTAVAWAPQMRVLERADLMITHGGLGSVKECLVNGVPMIVAPMARDQPANARRVEHHRLGRRVDLDELTAEGLSEKIRGIIEDAETRAALARLAEIFRSQEEAQTSALAVEELLGREPLGREPLGREPGASEE